MHIVSEALQRLAGALLTKILAEPDLPFLRSTDFTQWRCLRFLLNTAQEASSGFVVIL